MTDTQCKNMTLNDLFEIHMDTRKLAESTQANYRRMWNSRALRTASCWMIRSFTFLSP